MDALSVLDWTAIAADLLADLREFGGAELADAVLQWLTVCGADGTPLLRLLLSAEAVIELRSMC